MGFDGKCKLHAYEIESRNETEYQRPRMDFICIPTHFGTHFEYIWLRVKLSTEMDSDGYFKLHSYEIEWQNETECQAHRLGFTCALTIFCIDFEAIRLSVKLSTKVGFNGYYKLHTDKIETRNETVCQTPRMDFICALPHLACMNPSESVLNFPQNRILTRTANCMCVKTRHKINWVANTLIRLDMHHTHFGTHFESIQLDGKLSAKLGFDGKCKLRAYEIESRN